jgi:hypothetical protein
MMNFAAVFVVREFDDYVGTWFCSQMTPLDGMMEVVYEKDCHGNEIKFRTIHHKHSRNLTNVFTILMLAMMTFFLTQASSMKIIVGNINFLVIMVIALILVVYAFSILVSCLIGNSEKIMDRMDARANIFQVA